MKIERNKKEIIIRLPASVNTDDLQDFIGYARYKELTSKSKAIRIGGLKTENVLLSETENCIS
jgi:hypothetical protein